MAGLSKEATSWQLNYAITYQGPGARGRDYSAGRSSTWQGAWRFASWSPWLMRSASRPVDR